MTLMDIKVFPEMLKQGHATSQDICPQDKISEEWLPRYYMHIDLCTSFKTQIHFAVLTLVKKLKVNGVEFNLEWKRC